MHHAPSLTRRLHGTNDRLWPDAGFHADQAWRHNGKACFYLATRPLLPQHDNSAPIQTYDVERVLADVDAYGGDRIPERASAMACSVSLVPRTSIARWWEHGRTIPLTDIRSEGASLAADEIAIGITRAHDGDYDHTNVKYTFNRCAPGLFLLNTAQIVN